MLPGAIVRAGGNALLEGLGHPFGVCRPNDNASRSAKPMEIALVEGRVMPGAVYLVHLPLSENCVSSGVATKDCVVW